MTKARLRSNLTAYEKAKAAINDRFAPSLRAIERAFGKCRVDSDCPSGICQDRRCHVDLQKEQILESREVCRDEAKNDDQRKDCDIKANDQLQYTCAAPLMTVTDAYKFNDDKTGRGFARRGNCFEKYQVCRKQGYQYDEDDPDSNKMRKATESDCRKSLHECSVDMHCPATQEADYRNPSTREEARKIFKRKVKQPNMQFGLPEHCSDTLLDRKFDISCPECVVDSDCHKDGRTDGQVCNSGQCVRNGFCSAPEDLTTVDKDRMCNHGDRKAFVKYMRENKIYDTCSDGALLQKYERTCQDIGSCTKTEQVGDKGGSLFATYKDRHGRKMSGHDAKNRACGLCVEDPEERVAMFSAEMKRKGTMAGCSDKQMRQKFENTCKPTEEDLLALMRSDESHKCKMMYLPQLPRKTVVRNALNLPTSIVSKSLSTLVTG